MIDGVDALDWRPTIRAGQKQAKRMTFLATGDFQEQSAAIAAGLRWEDYLALPGTPDWIDPERPTTCKTHVIAWYLYKVKLDAIANGG